MNSLSSETFGENAKADSANVIMNEAALKTMGMSVESAVGTKIKVWGRESTIIGVVKDFNFKPVQEPIGPMFLTRNSWGGTAMIRTQPGETENTIAALIDSKLTVIQAITRAERNAIRKMVHSMLT